MSPGEAGDFRGLWQPDAMDIALMISEGKYTPPSRAGMVKEITGDIWDYHDKGHWIVITTNGTLNRQGDCVMGKGVALEAKRRFWNLAHWLGFQIKHKGNHCYAYTLQQRAGDGFRTLGLVTFPTKHDWREKSDMDLIDRSCKELVAIVDERGIDRVYMVRPGCRNGRLEWEDVKPLLEKHLDDRFTVVEREER